jgi:hypothetical protein
MAIRAKVAPVDCRVASRSRVAPFDPAPPSSPQPANAISTARPTTARLIVFVTAPVPTSSPAAFHLSNEALFQINRCQPGMVAGMCSACVAALEDRNIQRRGTKDPHKKQPVASGRAGSSKPQPAAVELRPAPPQHPRMERPPPRRTLPRRDVPDHRRTHRLPRPLEPDLDTYPLRSLVLELDEEAVH